MVLVLSFLKYLAEKCQKKFIWKYFATSHGKGVCDGVGGRIKSLVRLAVTSKKSKRTIIHNSEDLLTTANPLTCKTQILNVSENEIEPIMIFGNNPDHILVYLSAI